MLPGGLARSVVSVSIGRLLQLLATFPITKGLPEFSSFLFFAQKVPAGLLVVLADPSSHD